MKSLRDSGIAGQYTREILTELKKLSTNDFTWLENHPHIIHENSELMAFKTDNIDEWIKDGSSYTWYIVAVTDRYIGLVDTAYGLIAFYDTEDTSLHISKNHIIVTEKVIMLDREYYNVDNYFYLAGS